MPANPTTIATSVFRFTTPVCADQVWGALTRPELTAQYLFGMAVESDWRPGSPVVVQPPVGSGVEDALAGEVLAVEEGRRLSFTFSSGPSDPATFVTWEIQTLDEGAEVSLFVDETQLAGAPDGDAESAWAQVVTALRSTLARLLR